MSDIILVAFGFMWSAAIGHDFGRYRQRKIAARNPSSFHIVGEAIWKECGRIRVLRKCAGALFNHNITCELECGSALYTVTIRPKTEQEVEA